MQAEYFLMAVIAAQLVHAAFTQRSHARLVDTLTSKLMAKDLREYALAEKPRPTPVPVERQRVVGDPVLGTNY